MPALQIEGFFAQYKTRRVISRAKVRREGTEFHHKWALILGKDVNQGGSIL